MEVLTDKEKLAIWADVIDVIRPGDQPLEYARRIEDAVLAKINYRAKLKSVCMHDGDCGHDSERDLGTCHGDIHVDPDSFDGTMCEECAPNGPSKDAA